ncbi:hypothetical protein QTP88_007133 [Uroleucon formosanum]
MSNWCSENLNSLKKRVLKIFDADRFGPYSYMTVKPSFDVEKRLLLIITMPSPLLLQSHTIPKHRRKLSSNSPRTYHLPKKKNIRESFATYRPDRRFSAVQNAIGRRRDIYRDLSYHGRRPPPTAPDNSDRYCGGGLWNNCS